MTGSSEQGTLQVLPEGHPANALRELAGSLTRIHSTVMLRHGSHTLEVHFLKTKKVKALHNRTAKLMAILLFLSLVVSLTLPAAVHACEAAHKLKTSAETHRAWRASDLSDYAAVAFAILEGM